MVKAKAEESTIAEVYCHVCSQLAGEMVHHGPPKCEPAKAEPKSAADDESDLLSSLAPGYILDPITGEILDPADATYIDDLIDSYERISALDSKLYAAKCAIRQALADRTEGDAKTRRVAGKRRLVKLEFPGDKFEQSILKEAWQSYPQFRDEYLRIAEIAPKLREVKKLENLSGDESLCCFRDIVLSANKGNGGALPTVKIEK